MKAPMSISSPPKPGINVFSRREEKRKRGIQRSRSSGVQRVQKRGVQVRYAPLIQDSSFHLKPITTMDREAYRIKPIANVTQVLRPPPHPHPHRTLRRGPLGVL